MGTPRVLVTGCAGYIGSVLTGLLLEKGCHVIGVDNLIYNNGNAVLGHLGCPRFEFFRDDVRDIDKLRYLIDRCDVVVPLAAIVGAPACDSHPEYAVAVNQEAIVSMVKLVCPQKRIISVNTNSGYGATDGTRFCTETDPLNPISVYGKTKCEAERAVLTHSNSVSLRLATVFAASPRMRMDLMVNDFVCEILSEAAMEIFEPHFKRNFVHVRDVAKAIFYMIGKPHLKGVFNVGLPDANLTKMELAWKICDDVGMSRECICIGTGRDEDQRNYLVSSQKLLDTGFRFEKTLSDGIREVRQICSMFYQFELASMRNV